MDFSNYKFHCSSLGDIMTNSRTKDALSETCKNHLMRIWIYQKYGRYKEEENKYIQKGNMAEEDGITLYSLVSNTMFVKNTQVFENDFIVGTPDIIHNNIVRDIKNSWSIYTFYETMVKALNKDYLWQLNGYWALIPECKAAKLVYVLINTPAVIIEQEKSRLRYKMGLIDPDANQVYLEACEEIDKNCIFDDIPNEERYIEMDVPQMDMEEVYERVKQCRNFLNNLK